MKIINGAFWLCLIAIHFTISGGQPAISSQAQGADIFVKNHPLVIAAITANPQALENLTAYYQKQNPGISAQQFLNIFNGLPVKTKLSLLNAITRTPASLPSYAELASASSPSAASYPSAAAAFADYTHKYIALLPTLNIQTPNLANFQQASKKFLQSLGYSDRIVGSLQPYTESLMNQGLRLSQALQAIKQTISQNKKYPTAADLQSILTSTLTPQIVRTPEIQSLINAYATAIQAPTPNPLLTASNTLLQKNRGTNELVNASQYLLAYSLKAAGEESALS
jgi:hypothetical protein